MSYAADVKHEICALEIDQEYSIYELKAMMHISSSIHLSSNGNYISFQSATAYIARRFLKLVKKYYNSDVELIQKHDHKLNRKFLYSVNVLSNVSQIMYDMQTFSDREKEKQDILNNPQKAANYIRGAFLCCGSVNNPQTGSYHLEFGVNNENESVFLIRMINKFDLNAKITKRRNHSMIYLKDAENIVDLLRIIGAQQEAFKFEDVRIKRDFNNSINRVINCEIANQTKTAEAAKEQLKYIQYIEYNYPLEKLDGKILLIMKVRKENPEASLNELIAILKDRYQEDISKSGLNHRFRKIKEIALELQNIKNRSL